MASLKLSTVTVSESSASSIVDNDSLSEVATPVKNPRKRNDASLLHRAYRRDRLPSEQVDYIIVGSGIGGLWLAACLAKFNVSSLVLEQHSIAGGFQHVFSRGKYEFVPGLHYVANPDLCIPLYEAVSENSNETGIPKIVYKIAGDSVKADLSEHCSHDLQIAGLPLMHIRRGRDRVREELLRVFPDETQAVDAFLATIEKAKWQAGIYNVFKIFPKWLQWLLR